MNKKYLIIGGIGCVVLLCLCVALIGGAFALGMLGTQPAADAGENFMKALQAGNYSQAYGLMDPRLQQKVGGVSGLQKMVETGKARPTKWSFTSRSIDNDKATLSGTVSMTGGDGTVSLDLINSSGTWKVTSFDLSAN